MMAFVQLDLFNFTESVAEESQYVLTSPRSLQACARHGIKPVELLPKSLEEFVEENDVKGFRTDVVDVMHKKSERERLRKLRVCREERERIIDEQEVFRGNDVGTDSESENSIENLVLDEDSQWQSLTEEKEEKTPRRTIKDKPSILSFLENSHSPRTSTAKMRVSRTPRTLGETSDQLLRQTSEQREHFKILSGSESDEADFINHDVMSNRSSRLKSKTILSDDRPPSSRVSPRRLLSSGHADVMSMKSSVGDLADSLPETLKKNLSLVSEKDKRLLEIMMLKTKEESLAKDLAASLDRENSKLDQPSKKASAKSDYSRKIKERDQRHKDVLLRKQYMDRDVQLQREAELNTKNSKWQREFEKQMNKKKCVQLKKHVDQEEKKKRQEDNLQQLSRGHRMWNDITYQETLQKLGNQQQKLKDHSKSITGYKKQQREQIHNDLMVDIEDKHLRAQAHFQQQMRKKDMERTLQKMKEEERKKQREKQMHIMNKDLQMWQKELQEFQSINSKRADHIVGKKNAVKSFQAHNKRLQKQLDHAALKARLDEEEQLRREELQAIIDLKDQRSKLIHQEKEDFAKAGREAARASRSIRENIKEQAVKSSFDKMAAEAEKIARIEKLRQTPMKKTSYPSVHKSRTTLTLG